MGGRGVSRLTSSITTSASTHKSNPGGYRDKVGVVRGL